MVNINKISACFLCLRNVEKIKAGHGYNNFNGNLVLLKRFLSWSLDLPPAVIGDILCTNVGTGGDQQGQEENLLCGSCEMEMGAACQLYQDLAKKLMELEEIVENSVKKVSDKLNANLHQKVAKQLNHSFGSSKEGGQRVQRLRDLLSMKLATAKTKCIEDEVSRSNRAGESGVMEVSEVDDCQEQGVQDNRRPNEPETETVNVIVKVDSDQRKDKESGATEPEACGVKETVEENEGMDLDVCEGDGGHRHDGSTSRPASTAKGKENRGLGVVKPAFKCDRCSENFRDMDSVQRHQRRCKPLISSGNGNPTPISTMSEMTNSKQVELGNGRFLRARVDIDMGEWSNSSAAEESEADAGYDTPFQCLRCNDLFKNIQDVKKHEKWCKPLKVLETKPGSPQEKLGRRPYSGPSHNGNSKYSKRRNRCRFCDKICPGDYQLKRHERTHTGEKPFQCPACKRRFNDRSSCLRHLKRCKVARIKREIKNGNEVSEAISLEMVTVAEQVGDVGNGEMNLEPGLQVLEPELGNTDE